MEYEEDISKFNLDSYNNNDNESKIIFVDI